MEKTIFGVWRRTEWEWWMTLTVWLLNLNFSDRNDAEVQMQISKFEKREVERGAAGGLMLKLQDCPVPDASPGASSVVTRPGVWVSSPPAIRVLWPRLRIRDTDTLKYSLILDFACESSSKVVVCLWALGMGEDEHEGEFVIQTEEEPNESPPLLPRRFLWPLVAGLQVPWSVVSIDGGQQLTSGEWGAWHPPPGWCQTSTTSHWLHWAALISTCKWYWEQHFSFRKITGNVE